MDPSITRLFELLPQLLTFAQAIIYVIFIWFFGAIAMKGLKKHLSFPFRTILTFCVGFLCLVSGVALSGYIVFLQDKILELFQVGVTVGGLISSIIFAIAFYLISRKVERTDPKTLIEKLKRRVGLLEGLLVEHKVPPLKEEEVKKKAKKLLRGYEIKEAKLKKTDWEITMVRGKKKARIVMGAYDGEVKFMEHEVPKLYHLISDPLRVAGIGMIIFILGFSILNFRGFPTMAEGISSLFASSSYGLGGILGVGEENLPEGCISAGKLALRYNPRLPLFENETIERMIERGIGRDVQWMYKIEYEGTEYILAIDSDFENVCSAREDRVCHCIKIPFL